MKIDTVRSLLPESIQTISRLIGMPLALKLVEDLGGTTFPVSKAQTRQGEIRFEVLAEVVGVNAASILTSHYGGDTLYIPSCSDALRQLRNLEIVARFDSLSREIGANAAVANLARENKLSDRRIWDILKNTDASSATVRPQDDLFGNE